jgi:hypothetical protein
MHPIDQAIFDNTLTQDLLRAEAGKPLPPEGSSYWGDAMRALWPVRGDLSAPSVLESLPARAAKLAAAQMGVMHTFILGGRAA